MRKKMQPKCLEGVGCIFIGDHTMRASRMDT